MNKSRKSQAAMEFLLTYGWAILVVLVAVGALAYYGVLDPTMLLPEKCIIQRGPLDCIDQKAFVFSTINGQFHMKFQNVLDKAVEIRGIRIFRDGFDCTSGFIASPRTVAGGDQICIPFSCQSIPQKTRKQGFQLEIKYAPSGGFEKSLSGELFTTMRQTSPYYMTGCPMPPGDGNGDGKIDETDVILVRDAILLRPDETVYDYSAYDFDGDGVNTGVDFSIINNILSACKCCTEDSPKLEVAKLYKEDSSYSIQQGCWTRCGKEVRISRGVFECQSYP